MGRTTNFFKVKERIKMTKNLSRRIFLKLAATGSAGALLAACAPAAPQVIEKVVTQQVEKVVTQQVEKVVTQQVEKIVQTTPTPMTGNLQYFTYSWSPNLEEMQHAKSQAFERAFPGTKVDVVVMPWDDIWTKASLTFAAGNPPDLIEYDFPLYTLFKKGIMLDLMPYIQAEPELLDAEVYNQLYWNMFTFKPGSVYAMPERIAGNMIWLNLDLFKAAGVEPPAKDYTFDDFVEIAKKLTVKKGGGQDIWGCSTGEYTAIYGWLGRVWGNGGELVDKTPDPTQLFLDDPKVYDAVQWVADLIYKHKVAPTPAQQQALVGGDFLSGKVAMVENGDWFMETNKAAKFNWDLALLPKGPGGNTSGHWVYGVGICKGSKNPDLAWKYVRFLSQQEAQTVEATYSPGIPFLNSVANSGLFQKPSWAPEHYSNRWETIKGSRVGDVFHENWNAMQSEILNPEGTDPIWLGEKPAKETFTAIADKCRKKLFG
jgi:multiple sugar transport system substrate-binding protein